MQLRISLQRSNFNYEKNEYCKTKTKIFLPAQYSMSFPDKHPEVLYILVYIKLHIGNDMDKVHYVCNVLYYNTGAWWNSDDETITQYLGYPMNVYDDLSIDKKQNKKGKKMCMDGSDRILYMLYIRKGILALRTYSFITGKSVSKEMDHIKERMADFGAFKE